MQGVNNYLANIMGFLLSGSDDGAMDMAANTRKAAEQCPEAKVVLSGFSQGAQVVHKAAKLLEKKYWENVGAIVLFGDPKNGELILREVALG